MAITAETIKANESLSGLTEDQVNVITTLSANEEVKTINTRIGEHHGLIEKDVFEASGVQKNDGEKSYDYMKRVVGSFKEKASSATVLEQSISDYKNKVADLESKIADGKGGEALSQKLKDTESQLMQLQTQYDQEKTGWTEKEQEFNGKIQSIHVNSELGKARNGLKFKPEYPESVQKTLIETTEKSILSKYKADFVETDGKKTMVFRDEEGEIARNPNNALNPYTAKELMSEALKDVLSTGTQKSGAGTTPGSSKGIVSVADIGGAKTQLEANTAIRSHISQLGIPVGTKEFSEKQKELSLQLKVSSLPLK